LIFYYYSFQLIILKFNKKTKGSALKDEAKICNISGGGLKKWVDTRWHTMYDCVDSIMCHKIPLENVRS
jgi:hypothetical protein